MNDKSDIMLYCARYLISMLKLQRFYLCLNTEEKDIPLLVEVKVRQQTVWVRWKVGEVRVGQERG